MAGSESHLMRYVLARPKFSLNDWYLAAWEDLADSKDQHLLADRIKAECDRVMGETSETALKNRQVVDHQLKVKIRDIEFKKAQLEAQKKEMDLEVEALKAYKQRILDEMNSLSVNALDMSRKCLMLRENRLGVDLCLDDVQLELLKECQVIEDAQGLMGKVVDQVDEQMRKLRALTYPLVRDLEGKDAVLMIDRHTLTLKETGLTNSLYDGGSPLEPAEVTPEEWAVYTEEKVNAACKELNSGRPLRAYIDVLLKQIVEDVRKQHDVVDEAFRVRIDEYKELKEKLVTQHSETIRQANEMSMTISRLDQSIGEAESFMALCHSRLGNRSLRPGVELCRDEAEKYLIKEVNEIVDVVSKLQKMRAEVEENYLTQHS